MPDGMELNQFRSAGEPLHIQRLDPLVVQILRRRTPAERCKRVLELNRLVGEGVGERPTEQHCAWLPERVHRELLRSWGIKNLADFFARPFSL